MNLELIMDTIWEATGRLTYLDPDVDATELTFVANEGQRRVAFWKDKVSKKVARFRNLIAEMNYQTTNFTDTISAVNNTTFPYYIEVDGDNVGNAATDTDRYNGWVVEITSGDADGEILEVMDYDDTNLRLYLSDAFDNTPVADDTIKMYKRFERLLPSTHNWVSDHIQLPAESDRWISEGNLLEVLNVYDVINQTRLDRAPRVDYYELNNLSAEIPSMWFQRGNKIYYDFNADDDLWMKMEYYRLPTEMSALTDEPEIPEQFHYCIVMWGIWYVFQKGGESSRKYDAWNSWVSMMRETTSQYDVSMELVDSKFIPKME